MREREIEDEDESKSERDSSVLISDLSCGSIHAGLLMGILQGVKEAGWQDAVKIVACETEGANALAESLRTGERATVKITSLAKTLGADRVSRATMRAQITSRLTR